MDAAQLDQVGLGQILAGGLRGEVVAPVLARESRNAWLLHHDLRAGHHHRAEVDRQLRKRAQ